ncbi:MAG: VCBS repeat-containing protein [Elusimicrobia bacterium]|nr:VCBS repeat-containing protein [Elusimicrobiota bacterium]
MSFASFTDTGLSFKKFYQGGIVWGDFTQNGYYDIIVFGTTPSGNSITIYKNQNGTIDNNTPLGLGVSPQVRNGDIAAGDFNGDGVLDFALTGWNGLLGIYKGTGKETSPFSLEYSGSAFQYSSLAWVDIDADGDLDLIVSGHIAGTGYLKTVCVYNNGISGFSEETLPIPGFQNGDIAFCDYNQDGWADMAITGDTSLSASSPTVRSVVYKNLGYGEFEETVFISTALQNGSFAWFDYDADGDMDLFLTGYEKFATPEERVFIFRNKGSASNYDLEFHTWLVGVNNGQIAAGDVDNDGDGDFFVVGGSTGEASAMLYTYDKTGGKFVLSEELSPLGRGGKAAFADYDADGDLDLFYCGQDTVTTQGQCFLYRNDVSSNTPPGIPTGLNATVSAGYLVLTWNAPSDNETPSASLNYSLRIGTVSFSSNTVSGCVASPFLGYNTPCKIDGSPGTILAGIEEGVTYFWSVRSIDSGFETSGWSDEKVIFVKGVPPCAISNLTALPGDIDGEIKLCWTAPGNDGTFGKCVSYSVKYSSTNTISDESEFVSAAEYTNDWKPKIGGWTEERSITSLRPGTTFYFGVKGSDGFNYGSWSTAGVNTMRWAPAQDLIPSTPTFSADPLSPGDGFIDVEWNLNTEIDIDTYFLEMSTYSGGGFSLVFSTAHPGRQATITGLTNFVTYYFRLRVSDWRNHKSEYSAEASAYPYDTTSPAKITTLSAKRGAAGKIELSWVATGDSNYTGDITKGEYRVAFATYSIGSDTMTFANNLKMEFSTNTSVGNREMFTVTGLRHDTTYYFRIALADEVPNWSESSNLTYAKTVDTVPPAGITSLGGVTGTAAGSVALNWVSPGDNGWDGALTGKFIIDYDTFTKLWSTTTCKIEISTGSLFPFTKIQRTITGLIAGASYYFCIWSCDEEGNFSYQSNISTVQSHPDENPPSSAIVIPADEASYGKLDIISGTSSDDYGSVRNVWISTSGVSGNWLKTSGTENWFFDCSTFVWNSGSYYTILAKAEDSYGNVSSSFTVGVSSVSFYFDNQPPSQITGFYASTGALTGSVNLGWIAPADEHSVVEKYFIRYSTSAVFSVYSELVSTFVSSAGNSEIFSVTGLSPGVTYYFKIASIDSVDFFWSTSTFSDSASCLARYGPDIATYFVISIATTVTKGVPADFTVSCYNPHEKATQFAGTVSFGGSDCEFFPASYSFITADAGEKSFSDGAIFDKNGIYRFYVAYGSVVSSSVAVEVSDLPAVSVGSSGGKIFVDAGLYLSIPSGGLKQSVDFTINVLTQNSEIPDFGGRIPVFAIEISPDTVFSSASTLSCIYLDRDSDGYEDKTAVSETELGLFYYDGVNWRIIDDNADSASNVFVSKISATGKFAVFLKNGSEISASTIKPKRKIITPWDFSTNNCIEFTGASAPFTVKIFSATGKKVFEGRNCYSWPGTDSSGNIVPAGVYFYKFEGAGGSFSGAVVVVK